MTARKRKNIVLGSCFFATKNYLDQGILSKYVQGAYEMYFGYIHVFILKSSFENSSCFTHDENSSSQMTGCLQNSTEFL